jgi:hypothetical protein
MHRGLDSYRCSFAVGLLAVLWLERPGKASLNVKDMLDCTVPKCINNLSQRFPTAGFIRTLGMVPARFDSGWFCRGGEWERDMSAPDQNSVSITNLSAGGNYAYIRNTIELEF